MHIGTKGGGPRMCSRCGARVDERRGRYSAVCLVCGNPLPPAPGELAARKGSSTIYWILGIIAALVFVGGGILALLTILVLRSERADNDNGPDAAVVTVNTATPTNTPSAIPTLPSLIPSETPSASATAKPTPPPLTDEERDELAGNYTCSIDETPAFRCRVANNILEKLEGSQRFRGPVSKVAGGNLSFSGTYFCPFGACTRAVSTTFVRQGPGRYVGRFAKSDAPGSGGGGERVVLTKVR